jgi:hypothetical protein
METNTAGFFKFFWRITASHMITYFAMGLIALTVLDYKGSFETPPLSYLMKPVSSPWVAAGPVLQIIRGLIFAVSLWYFRRSFLEADYGWLKLWGLLVGLAVLSTAGPTPGSIEGMIYTKIPIADQLNGYIEVLPQTLLMSLGVYYWYKRPGKVWTVMSIVLVSLIVLMSVAALTIPR